MSDYGTEADYYRDYADDLGGFLCDECEDGVLDDGGMCPACLGEGSTLTAPREFGT